MVDVKNIQLFLGSLLLNECPCIHIASSMFERNILLRLQNVTKYRIYKMPQKGGFSPICDPPRFFFKNRALLLLYPYGALTSCKKLGNTNEIFPRYLKTDGLTRAITMEPIG